MRAAPCILYRDFPGHGLRKIRRTLDRALDRSTSAEPLPVLFRADDVGVPSANFGQLLDLFSHHRLPLCLAVVPSWLTAARWRAISSEVDTGSPQWCWHQHGWRHANHQRSGKKSEFGTDRDSSMLEADLLRGRERLESVLGPDFSPFFTPPWNRCSGRTLELLAVHGYHGVSRSKGEQSGQTFLADFYINVDPHTRKEANADSALEALCQELHQAVEQNYISVMIHHQLMDKTAFALLDLLLTVLSQSGKVRVCSFAEHPAAFA